MKTPKIQTAAVLGSGVMGSGIAALLAGAGIRTYLLDIVPRDLPEGGDRSGIAKANLKQALKAKPAAFYSKDDASLVIPGNFDDHLEKLSECDWVIEVVIENLQIKQDLMAKVAQHVGPDAIVSSNTSGIDIDAIVANLDDSFKKRWLGTHFFNPPRYMKLLELIPGKDTDPAVVERIATFGTDVLGKGIVYAKNTPNFIANRIGAFGMMNAMNVMLEDGLEIAEVDAVLGKAVGRPKTAMYKTADLVGIDTLVHVAKNTHVAIEGDPYRDAFLVPDFVQTMVDNGQIGNKAKAGFYKKDGKQRFVLDPKTGEYKELERPSFPCTEAAKGIEDVAKRIHAVMMDGDDPAAKFAWKTTIVTLLYSARLIPEIADRVVEVDRAMRWGYNWELGPFEIWDALGLEASVARMKAEGIEVPENIQKMLDAGATSFYQEQADGLYAYDLVQNTYVKVDEDPKRIWIPELKKADKVVKRNNGATLLDAGDGVLLVEFNTKMNAVDSDIGQMLVDAVDLAEQDGWKGVVIGNHADAFSAGANIMMLYMFAQQEDWAAIEKMVDDFQQTTMKLRYSDVPVVAAVGGLALGGGCEIAMHCDRVVLAGESYVGLVEVGVGLIPGGGGCKESVVKLQQGLPKGVQVSPVPFMQKAFENIATAKVATSGKEAIDQTLFVPYESRVVLNRDHIIQIAKDTVVGLDAAGYVQPEQTKIKLAGGGTYGAMLVGADGMQRAGFATEYDIHIAKKLAKVLTGGDIPENTVVDQQYVLDLEREAFLSLCGEQKTQDRIQHMLMKNRPLRN